MQSFSLPMPVVYMMHSYLSYDKIIFFMMHFYPSILIKMILFFLSDKKSDGRRDSFSKEETKRNKSTFKSAGNKSSGELDG